MPEKTPLDQLKPQIQLDEKQLKDAMGAVSRHVAWYAHNLKQFSYKDLQQEVWLFIARNLRNYDPARGMSLKIFIFNLAYYGIRRFARKQLQSNNRFNIVTPTDTESITIPELGHWYDAPLITKFTGANEIDTVEIDNSDLFARISKWLTARERYILTQVYQKERTYTDIGKDLGLSRERIRQIHAKIIAKLKRRVRRD